MTEIEIKAREILIKMQFQKEPLKFEQAKQCALISVDEMIEEISKWAGGDFIEWEKERWKYLQQIKQEIEKL